MRRRDVVLIIIIIIIIILYLKKVARLAEAILPQGLHFDTIYTVYIHKDIQYIVNKYINIYMNLILKFCFQKKCPLEKIIVDLE